MINPEKKNDTNFWPCLCLRPQTPESFFHSAHFKNTSTKYKYIWRIKIYNAPLILFLDCWFIPKVRVAEATYILIQLPHPSTRWMTDQTLVFSRQCTYLSINMNVKLFVRNRFTCLKSRKESHPPHLEGQLYFCDDLHLQGGQVQRTDALYLPWTGPWRGLPVTSSSWASAWQWLSPGFMTPCHSLWKWTY